MSQPPHTLPLPESEAKPTDQPRNQAVVPSGDGGCQTSACTQCGSVMSEGRFTRLLYPSLSRVSPAFSSWVSLCHSQCPLHASCHCLCSVLSAISVLR